MIHPNPFAAITTKTTFREYFHRLATEITGTTDNTTNKSVTRNPAADLPAATLRAEGPLLSQRPMESQTWRGMPAHKTSSPEVCSNANDS